MDVGWKYIGLNVGGSVLDLEQGLKERREGIKVHWRYELVRLLHANSE
jgi:hypothetical protein